MKHLTTIRNVRSTISMHSSIWALPTVENWVNKLHLLPTSGGYGSHVNQWQIIKKNADALKQKPSPERKQW